MNHHTPLPLVGVYVLANDLQSLPRAECFHSRTHHFCAGLEVVPSSELFSESEDVRRLQAGRRSRVGVRPVKKKGPRCAFRT